MFFIDWWNSLEIATQVFYCIAVPSTLVLIIQTVLMFLGLGEGADGDVDVDVDAPEAGDGIFGENSVSDVADTDISELHTLQIFTFRGIIAFLVVMGWVGVVMQSAGAGLAVTIPVSFVCGVAIMVAIAYLFKAVMKLKSNGTADNRNAVGTAGKVYLTIPPLRSGEGKVNIMLQGAYVERNAVTDEDAPIPTGCEIIVIGTSGQTSLVVKRK